MHSGTLSTVSSESGKVEVRAGGFQGGRRAGVVEATAEGETRWTPPPYMVGAGVVGAMGDGCAGEGELEMEVVMNGEFVGDEEGGVETEKAGVVGEEGHQRTGSSATKASEMSEGRLTVEMVLGPLGLAGLM